ncbi:MAG: translation initiation factor IF-2 subunit alpha [Asgard group archaeon]|nr:translation initiation factor IF-2 subunit alpha [Asgard group archaeon]
MAQKDPDSLENNLFDPERDMQKRYEGWPQQNELVIATVDYIAGHGFYAELNEYTNKRGYVHISEISRTWVKNIRNHVRDGQRIVAKVLRVDPQKNQIDLSIKRVPEQMRKLKILEAKRAQTANTLFKMIMDKVPKKKHNQALDIRQLLRLNFGTLYEGLEFAARSEVEDIIDLDIDKDWAEAIQKIASDNIKQQTVEIKGTMEISIPGGNGVKNLKKALIAGKEQVAEENTNIDIYTEGSPHYAIEVESLDYKTAEKALENAIERVKDNVNKSKGTITFKRTD